MSKGSIVTMPFMTDLRYPLGKFVPPAEYTPDARATWIREIEGAPAALGVAVAGLSTDQRLTPYRDDGWTVAQVVHHLADSHMHAYSRVKLAATEDVPTIKPYNEAIWATMADASHPNIDPSLRILESLHARWVVFLKSLSTDGFERRLMHPERGPMTIDRMVALYAWHGRHHVAHIVELRKRAGW
jgi:DinB superfamily